jgi:ABC-type polar amino acid transport system ATPase subunit
MTWPVSMHNMTKRFGDRTILDQITLTIRPGETAALIGPSGGGKSTLLRCLNGLNTFDGGAVQVGPHRLVPGNGNSRRDIQHVRRSFGLIFQDFQLFPHRNVLDNVTEAPTRVLGLPTREAQERARSLLERVGMGDFARAYPQQLSGGQKQRVAIARALAMQPRGLLCDEITSALDPELKHEVLNVIEDLKRDGLTIILVTHEIGFARRAADRVVMLDGGRVVEEGPPAEVLERPRSERMALFLKRVMG